MEYVYATLLLNETGEEINEDNLTATLETAGASVVRSRVKALVAALEDVDVDGLAREAGLDALLADEAAADGDATTDGEDEAAPDGADIVDDALATEPEAGPHGDASTDGDHEGAPDEAAADGPASGDADEAIEADGGDGEPAAAEGVDEADDEDDVVDDAVDDADSAEADEDR